jgi:hypothetical protein
LRIGARYPRIGNVLCGSIEGKITPGTYWRGDRVIKNRYTHSEKEKNHCFCQKWNPDNFVTHLGIPGPSKIKIHGEKKVCVNLMIRVQKHAKMF